MQLFNMQIRSYNPIKSIVILLKHILAFLGRKKYFFILKNNFFYLQISLKYAIILYYCL